MATRLVHGKTLSVVGLAGASPDNFYIRAFATHRGTPDMTAGLIAHYDGDEFRLIRAFDEEITGITYCEANGLLCVGELGTLHAYDGKTWEVLAADVEPRSRINDILIAGERTFGLAWRAKLYEFEKNSGEWTLHQLGGPRSKVRLLGGAADPSGNLVICGSRGFLKQGPIDSLRTVEIATDRDVSDVVWQGERFVAVGAKGLIAVGTGDAWEIMESSNFQDDLIGAQVWEGEVLVSGRNQILKVSDAEVTIFADRPSTILKSIGGTLFNIGFDTLHRLDSGEWSEIPVTMDFQG